MYGTVRVTKLIGSLISGHATTLNTRGTAKAVTRARHCRLTKGSRSRGASRGLTTSVSPIDTPAHHSWLRFPSSSQRRNSTSNNRMTPLMLPNTKVLVTFSVQNIASSSAGAATEARVKLNSRSRKYPASTIATVLKKMNQFRDASSGR